MCIQLLCLLLHLSFVLLLVLVRLYTHFIHSTSPPPPSPLLLLLSLPLLLLLFILFFAQFVAPETFVISRGNPVENEGGRFPTLPPPSPPYPCSTTSTFASSHLSLQKHLQSLPAVPSRTKTGAFHPVLDQLLEIGGGNRGREREGTGEA